MLKEMASRHDYVLATKVFFPAEKKGPNREGLSRSTSSKPATLRCAGSAPDFIDLYQVHRWDPQTPSKRRSPPRLAGARGKGRYLGASSMAAWQFAQGPLHIGPPGWERLRVHAEHYNLVYREEEREMIPLCIAEGVGCVPWSRSRAGS